ncbi:MAG: hypothetical protein QMB62_13255 [Oscillospiraceae bacterium]
MSKGTEIYEQSIVIDVCAPLACPYQGEYFNYRHYRGDILGGIIAPYYKGQKVCRGQNKKV